MQSKDLIVFLPHGNLFRLGSPRLMIVKSTTNCKIKDFIIKRV